MFHQLDTFTQFAFSSNILYSQLNIPICEHTFL